MGSVATFHSTVRAHQLPQHACLVTRPRAYFHACRPEESFGYGAPTGFYATSAFAVLLAADVANHLYDLLLILMTFGWDSGCGLYTVHDMPAPRPTEADINAAVSPPPPTPSAAFLLAARWGNTAAEFARVTVDIPLEANVAQVNENLELA